MQPVMTGAEIKTARQGLGLTQDALAEMILVDVTTVQRWEAGITEPGLIALQRLTDFFQKRPGLKHPFLDYFLGLDIAVGVLDEHAVYRRANRRFVDVLGFSDRAEILGHYCVDICEIWTKWVVQHVPTNPEDLLYSRFESISVGGDVHLRGVRRNFVHTITAVRQVEFSSFLLHVIEEIQDR